MRGSVGADRPKTAAAPSSRARCDTWSFAVCAVEAWRAAFARALATTSRSALARGGLKQLSLAGARWADYQNQAVIERRG